MNSIPHRQYTNDIPILGGLSRRKPHGPRVGHTPLQVECDVQHCLKLVTLDVIGSIGFGFNSNATMTFLPEKHPKALSKAEMERELALLRFAVYFFCFSLACSDAFLFLLGAFCQQKLTSDFSDVGAPCGKL